jgi:hypothetical protein
MSRARQGLAAKQEDRFPLILRTPVAKEKERSDKAEQQHKHQTQKPPLLHEIRHFRIPF